MSMKERIAQWSRNSWERIVAIVCTVVVIAVVSLLWLSIGAAISLTYCWLAGGEGRDSIVAELLLAWGPVVLFALIVIWFISHFSFEKMTSVYMRRPPYRTVDGVRKRMLRYWTGGPMFWYVFVWLTAPIMLNGLSMLISAIGFETVSGYVFEYRYYSLPAVPILFFGVIGAILTIGSLLERFSGNASPPSPPKGPDQPRTCRERRGNPPFEDPGALQLTAS